MRLKGVTERNFRCVRFVHVFLSLFFYFIYFAHIIMPLWNLFFFFSCKKCSLMQRNQSRYTYTGTSTIGIQRVSGERGNASRDIDVQLRIKWVYSKNFIIYRYIKNKNTNNCMTRVIGDESLLVSIYVYGKISFINWKSKIAKNFRI